MAPPGHHKLRLIMWTALNTDKKRSFLILQSTVSYLFCHVWGLFLRPDVAVFLHSGRFAGDLHHVSAAVWELHHPRENRQCVKDLCASSPGWSSAPDLCVYEGMTLTSSNSLLPHSAKLFSAFFSTSRLYADIKIWIKLSLWTMDICIYVIPHFIMRSPVLLRTSTNVTRHHCSTSAKSFRRNPTVPIVPCLTRRFAWWPADVAVSQQISVYRCNSKN